MQREQQRIAINVLQELVSLLRDRSVSSNSFELAARVYTLAHLLIEDPLVSEACNSVVRRFSAAGVNGNTKDAFARGLSKQVVMKINVAMGARWNDPLRDRLLAHVTLDKTVDWPDTEENQLTCRDLMDILRESGNVQRLTFSQIDHLRSIWPRFPQILGEILNKTQEGKEWVRLALEAASEVGEALQKNLSRFSLVYDSVTQWDLERLMLRLREFCEDVEDVRGGLLIDRPFAWSNRTSYNTHHELIEPMIRLASLVQVELATQPVQEHLVARLVAYFETPTFGGLSLMHEITNRPDDSIEDVIQETVDRFLFEQGVFPITHCKASSGALDTLVQEELQRFVSHEANPKLERAIRIGSPPLLLEFKQIIKNEGEGQSVTESEILKKAREAQAQAEWYARFVQASNPTLIVRVFVILFYNGEKTWQSPLPDVKFIYLGEKRPSGKRKANSKRQAKPA